MALTSDIPATSLPASSKTQTESFEQALVQSLDLDNWVTGTNLAELYTSVKLSII